ncbi:MAG: CYTH domain-containing protein [Microbacterium sp.]
MSEPSRFLEIELKFDVDPGTPVPDFTGVPGVASVSPGELRQLDALYLDTYDTQLSKAGVAVRRRTGGPDAGWHIKGPRTDSGSTAVSSRVELGWPDQETVPEAVTEYLAQWTTDNLRPLARIVNKRTAYELFDADGRVLAEFVDDDVRAMDMRTRVHRNWCEWEIELGEAAPQDPEKQQALLDALTEAARTAGAREPSSSSKLARALGH